MKEKRPGRLAANVEHAAQIELAFVLVHYKTPERLYKAVCEATASLHATGKEFRVIVVDNSGDIEPAALAEEHCSLLAPGVNLGYAGAANLAFRSVSARHYVLCNPDLSMVGGDSDRPGSDPAGCLGKLIQGCPENGVAGPRLFWDDDARLLLPPLEYSNTSRLRRLVSRLAPAWAAARRRRAWRRHARDHWTATSPMPSSYLSGALLVFSREALDRVGPLDENFRLYFEETDWQRRARTLDIPTLLVPGALAIHEFDQSAKLEPEAKQWYTDSESLFLKRYGIKPLSDDPKSEDLACPQWSGEFDPTAGTTEIWFELSPSPRQYPAAAERVALVHEGRPQTIVKWQPPKSIARRVSGWWLTLSDQSGREVGCFKIP